MIPLLDTLQSIPVLCFLPGVMVAMVALFPTRQLGVEFGSILLIFTGQVWNMAFSFYSSLKSIPREMLEAAELYRLSWWQRFIATRIAVFGDRTGVEFHDVGGGRMVLSDGVRDVRARQPRFAAARAGLVSADRAERRRHAARFFWGVAAMIAVIVMMDQLMWRPIDRVEREIQVRASGGDDDAAFAGARLCCAGRISGAREPARQSTPAREALDLHFARGERNARAAKNPRRNPALPFGARRRSRLAGIVMRWFAWSRCLRSSRSRNWRDFLGRGRDVSARGTDAGAGRIVDHPCRASISDCARSWRAIAQPLAQIAASVPATALFPIVLLVLIRLGGGLGIASIVLLLLGTQWYILFNVIAGATAIPTDLKEVCDVFRFGACERWRKLFLPGDFSLI